MANTPNPRSFQQNKGEMLDTWLTLTGIDDVSPGSVVDSLFTAAAQNDTRNSQDTFAILDSVSIDRATGPTLDNLGNDNDVPRQTATKALGAVTFTDSSFSKVSTKLYPGSPAPNVGSAAIDVADGALFPPRGSVFIGRNTQNVEGPIKYTSIVQVGVYWRMTLAAGTSRFHNLSETVILAQGGNRSIPAGTVAQTPGGSTFDSVKFSTTIAAVIQDGEDSLTNVPVVALEPGSRGNVPRNTIAEVLGNPYPNAGATNPLPFSTAQDQETDDRYRERIKRAIQSRSRGTALAIENAALGVTATDEPKRVLSAKVASLAGAPTTLFIDDGTGYEEISEGIGMTNVVDLALGGEEFLQLPDTVITKALLVTTLEEPFAIFDGDALAVSVGGERCQHVFQGTDFRSPGAATAFEIASSVNADPTVFFSATTFNGGKQVRLFAKEETYEDIQVVVPSIATDANPALGFSSLHTFTLLLYKNDLPLYKDGIHPTVDSAEQSAWSTTIATGDTLRIVADGKTVFTAPPDTYVFTDADFVAEGSGYTAVSCLNSLQSWANVISAKVPGVTAVVSSSHLSLSSNRGAADGASLAITGGTLVSKGMFSLGSVDGRKSDFAFNRNTGQVHLAEPLVADDRVTAGSVFTRGYVEGANIPGGGVVVPAGDAHLYVIVDGSVAAVPHGITFASSLVVTNPSADIWRYDFLAGSPLASVRAGDWVVVWDPAVSNPLNRGYWRVSAATATYFEVQKASGAAGTYSFGTSTVGIAFARSSAPMQMVTVPAGTYILPLLVVALNVSLSGAEFTVVDGKRLRLTPLTYGPAGGSVVVAADGAAKQFMLPENEPFENRQSHTAFAESVGSELGTPYFFATTLVTGDASEPGPTGPVTPAVALEALGADRNSALGFLRPFGAGLYSSNRGNYARIARIDGVTPFKATTLRSKPTVHQLFGGGVDRVFAAKPFDFDGEDSLVVAMDNDPVNETFVVPMARNVTANNIFAPTATQFDAYDTDAGPTGSLASTFGPAFSFNDYKLWSRSRGVLDPSGANNAVLFRHPVYGPNGDSVRVGYFYPTVAGQAIGSDVVTGEYTSVKIFLPSGAKRAQAHTLNTTFTVSVAPLVPLVSDTVTYIYGSGPAPLFVTNGVVVGDIFAFGSGSDLLSANQGAFRVTNVTETTLECVRTVGLASNDPTPRLLRATDNLQVYPLAATSTGAAVVAYVGTGLSAWLEAALTTEDPLSSPNSGNDPISMSTLDDAGYASGREYVGLVDGEKWVLGSNTLASPQFTLKSPLAMSSPLYSVVGERFKLIPAWTDDAVAFMNTLGVTGLSTSAGITASGRGGKIQIYSKVVGTAGAVQVTGGTANATDGDVLGSAGVVDAAYTQVRVPYSTRHGFHAGQFVRVTSTASQPKTLGTDGSTKITVVGGLLSTVSIVGGTAGSFRPGTPRVHSGDASTKFQVERHGSYTYVVWNGAGTDPALPGPMVEGDWVKISGNFAPLNQGTFRVIRTYGEGFYVENPLSVEEVVTLSAGTDLEFSSYDSVMPGDRLVVGGTVLGTANQGTWPVVSATASTMVIAGAMTSVGPVTLGTDYPQVQVTERRPFGAIKRIHAVAQDPTDSTQLDVTLYGTSLASKINALAGSALSAEGKFAFGTDVNLGIDGYRRYTGLVAEVNRVIYGDPQDPAGYPGVKAAGADLNIQGPLVRRITVSLSVRVKTGVPFSQVAGRVRSGVAAVVNSLGVGQPVVISDLVTAAGKVDGVLAVSVISPAYDSSSDLIAVQSYEKPLVIDADSDVVVSQTGA